MLLHVQAVFHHFKVFENYSYFYFELVLIRHIKFYVSCALGISLFSSCVIISPTVKQIMGTSFSLYISGILHIISKFPSQVGPKSHSYSMQHLEERS